MQHVLVPVVGLTIFVLVVGVKLLKSMLAAEVGRDVIEASLLDVLDMHGDLGAGENRKFVCLLEESILPLDERNTAIPVVIDEL